MKTNTAIQKQIIQEFKESFPWARDICSVKIGSDTFLCSDEIFYIPIHWEDYCLHESTYYESPAVMRGTLEVEDETIPICFLIGGNPPPGIAHLITAQHQSKKTKGCNFKIQFANIIQKPTIYDLVLITARVVQ